MSDAQGADEGGTSGESTAANVGNEISDTFSKMSGGERFAVLGAVIVLADWLLFDLLIDDYGMGSLPFALAVLIVGAAYFHHRRSGDDPVPYGSLLFAAAGILGLLGVVDVIEEVRNDIFDRDATTVVGALIYYGGAILSGVGALQLKNNQP
ncbi:MAG: hypothetical protein ACR2P0_17225 [Acidimicrobiales bacterium]